MILWPEFTYLAEVGRDDVIQKPLPFVKMKMLEKKTFSPALKLKVFRFWTLGYTK